MIKVIGTLLALAILSSSVSAGIITFNDRAAFDAYVGAVVVDNLNGIPYASGSTGVRSDYSWTMDDWGCPNSQGCSGFGGINPFVAPGNDWVWTYNSGSFNMNFGVTAFGLDYANPYSAVNGTVGLNGYTSGSNPNGSFFGIATDDGSLMTSISYTQFSTYQGFDNVTFSVTPNGAVPEPATLALFGLALAGLGLKGGRGKRKA